MGNQSREKPSLKNVKHQQKPIKKRQNKTNKKQIR
jgi:hypothetical protein